MTSTTMSRCPGTVETRRTRPRPCPHAGHFRSIFIDGVARGINPGDLRIHGALTQIKVMRCATRCENQDSAACPVLCATREVVACPRWPDGP
jgi:hypothetical protein